MRRPTFFCLHVCCSLHAASHPVVAASASASPRPRLALASRLPPLPSSAAAASLCSRQNRHNAAWRRRTAMLPLRCCSAFRPSLPSQLLCETTHATQHLAPIRKQARDRRRSHDGPTSHEWLMLRRAAPTVQAQQNSTRARREQQMDRRHTRTGGRGDEHAWPCAAANQQAALADETNIIETRPWCSTKAASAAADTGAMPPTPQTDRTRTRAETAAASHLTRPHRCGCSAMRHDGVTERATAEHSIQRRAQEHRDDNSHGSLATANPDPSSPLFQPFPSTLTSAAATMFGGDEVGALVLDLGTQFSKAGYAGEDTPKAVFHTAVGTLYSEDEAMDVEVTEHASGVSSSALGSSAAAAASSSSAAASSSSAAAASKKRVGVSKSGKSYFVGRNQLFRRDGMVIESPLKHGLVQDWDAVERIWDYALTSHLRVDAKDHPLMISEPTFQPQADREKMLQMMFERFDAPAAYLCKSSVLTAFSAGRSTACVVESGAGHTTVSPIHDGYVVSKGVRRSQMAGSKLDELLEKVLTQDGKAITPAYMLNRKVDADGNLAISPLSFPQTHPSFHALQVGELIRDLKESLCRLGESSFDNSQKFPTVSYELPDGQCIEVGNERFVVPEHIFNPKYSGMMELKHDFDGFHYRGLHHMVLDSVESVDVDLRKELYGNVVLSGGNTLFPGTPNRLTKEVGGILSAAHKVKVVGGSSLNDRRFGVWIGGSILASLGTFHQMWISKAEYEEHGAALLAAKCP